MIAQYIAIDYPELVNKLVIGVSISKPNDMMKGAIMNWIKLAQNRDYKNLIIDTLEKTFTEDLFRRYRILYPIVIRI